MKKNRLLVVSFLLLFATGAGIYFLSCQRDDTSLASTPKPLTDTPVGERACTSGDFCEYTLIPETDCTVEFCGDIDPSTGFCTACNTNSADLSLGNVVLYANTPYTICVRKNGSMCIRNYPTGTHTIQMTVQAGNSTPLSVTIPVNQSSCIHSNNA